MPSFVIIEEDLTDSKAHTYPRRRSHTIGSSNAEFHDGKKMNLLFLKCVWSHFRILSTNLEVCTQQYFPVVLFIVLYKVFLTYEGVDEILWCDHSNESY